MDTLLNFCFCAIWLEKISLAFIHIAYTRKRRLRDAHLSQKTLRIWLGDAPRMSDESRLEVLSRTSFSAIFAKSRCRFADSSPLTQPESTIRRMIGSTSLDLLRTFGIRMLLPHKMSENRRYLPTSAFQPALLHSKTWGDLKKRNSKLNLDQSI